MPHLFTVPAGLPIADVAAKHILSTLTREERPQAVVFVPTRRAAVTMRAAFQSALAGEASLLPRILPLADADQALLTLLGAGAVELLAEIPPAMPEWQQRYLLTAQVKRFLERQQGVVTLDYALALAEELMALQEQCARAGVTLTRTNLRQLVRADMATHWEQALAFLGILADYWPEVEREEGMITAAAREVRLLGALAEAWCASPPTMPVFVVGSTASQESTAALLQAIAESPRGAVILPGLDPSMAEEEWQRIGAGHPLFHLKHFVERCGVSLGDVIALTEKNKCLTRSVWMDALVATEEIPHWQQRALPEYAHLRLIPCAHAESEARVIALLLREALETPGKRTALITPDEGLMARVAVQMKRYGVTIDRLSKGTLATTDSGSVWTLLMAALSEPERLIHLRSLLHHPLVAVDPHFLNAMEPYWYGVAVRRAGQLPKMPEPLRAHEAYGALEYWVRAMARLARGRMHASEWVSECRALLSPWVPIAGVAAEALEEALLALNAADILGVMELREFASLLTERLAQPVRHGGVATHPQLFMLTPVEARLQQFDRVILASMTDALWPGITPANAWLNLAAQEALGLPSPAHHVSLMAHDVLMFGSAAEVFLTWPLRDQGSPTTRSRFIERLVTLLAMHGVDEAAITARVYEQWAEEAHAAHGFHPHAPITPRPSAAERPHSLPVSALDTLFSDPFAIYARYVLGLKELEAMDAEPEASDFGSLAHRAIQALTTHWNTHQAEATTEQLAAMADAALRDFADRPSTALFWRTRLIRALGFVNGIESERRESPAMQVQPEMKVEAVLALSLEKEITLHGRIDRVEASAGGAIIADYKTGTIPTDKKIREGYATQLLAYAMLLDAPAQAIEYWRLPHGKHKGEVTQVLVADLLANQLPEKLKAALLTMMDTSTPLLANPGLAGHAYDGISRYDEWAG